MSIILTNSSSLKKYTITHRALFARSGLTLCTIGIGTQPTKEEPCGCGEECERSVCSVGYVP